MKTRYVVFLTILLPISITFLVAISSFENPTPANPTTENNTPDLIGFMYTADSNGDSTWLCAPDILIYDLSPSLSPSGIYDLDDIEWCTGGSITIGLNATTHVEHMPNCKSWYHELEVEVIEKNVFECAKGNHTLCNFYEPIPYETFQGRYCYWE